ncbi:MAG: penicillin-binding protein 2 [bacterium]|nr:penicillin-binding protein 2 [bacterium]
MKVKRKNHEFEFEDVFLDKIAKQRAQEDFSEEIKLENPLSRKNFLILNILIFLTLFTLGVFALKMQIFNKEEYEALAQKNKYVSISYSSERGIITDRNNTPLVENEISFDLYYNPEASSLKEQTEKDLALKEISLLLGKSKEKVQEIISNPENKLSSENLWLVKKDLSHQELVLYEAKKENLPFLTLERRALRKYTEKACLGHVLGYLGKISKEEFAQSSTYAIADFVGRSGIENVYENILKEKKGEVKIERTAKGEEIARKVVSFPQSGDSVKLEIDLALQEKTVEILQATLEEAQVKKGVVMALNPKTGAILSLVSLPCFDNNLFASGISENDWQKLNLDPLNPQLNRALGGLYPTGSSLKPFVGIAALNEGIITENTSFYCPLELCIENQYNPKEATCFPDNAYHGWSNIKRAIAESVNPFFYLVAGGYTPPKKSSVYYIPKLPNKIKGLGAEKLAEYLKMFGFNEATKVDLTGEVSGRVPTPEWKENYFSDKASQMWYLGDTYNLSIGQGFMLATPLELAKAYMTLINDGLIITPHIAQKETAIEGKLDIAEKYFKIIKEGMRQCVTNGSCSRLKNLPFTTAGKTGTAQVYSNREIYNNWIAAFAPFEDPEILVIVLIEEVEGLRASAQQTAEQLLYYYFVTSKIKQ